MYALYRRVAVIHAIGRLATVTVTVTVAIALCPPLLVVPARASRDRPVTWPVSQEFQEKKKGTYRSPQKPNHQMEESNLPQKQDDACRHLLHLGDVSVAEGDTKVVYGHLKSRVRTSERQQR